MDMLNRPGTKGWFQLTAARNSLHNTRRKRKGAVCRKKK
jgi:hypothetical protein